MFFAVILTLAAIFVIVAIILMLKKRKSKSLNPDIVPEDRLKEPPAGNSINEKPQS